MTESNEVRCKGRVGVVLGNTRYLPTYCSITKPTYIVYGSLWKTTLCRIPCVNCLCPSVRVRIHLVLTLILSIPLFYAIYFPLGRTHIAPSIYTGLLAGRHPFHLHMPVFLVRPWAMRDVISVLDLAYTDMPDSPRLHSRWCPRCPPAISTHIVPPIT